MPSWSEQDLAKILSATDEHMTDGHFEARLTLVEDGLAEFRATFKEHTKHEEQAVKDLTISLNTMSKAINETNAMIRENMITGSANLQECGANLRRDVLQEVYGVFEKRTEAHNKDVDKVWVSIRSANKDIDANKLKLERITTILSVAQVIVVAVMGFVLKKVFE